MKNFTILFFLLLLVACSSVKQVTSGEQTTIEVRTKTVYVPDTVYIERPQIIEKVQVIDTASTIENKYACSQAIVSAGVLSHSLEVKPIKEPIKIESRVEYRDSIVLQQVDVDHYIDVPAELTPWQSFKIRLGGYAFALIILLIVCATIYFIIHTKLFKL